VDSNFSFYFELFSSPSRRIFHNMPRDRTRPDPVSCQTCRSKKLKCNRVQPCSNCTARGITCKFLIPPQEKTGTTSTFYSNAELLGRIKRLESIVLKQTGPVETIPKDASSDSHISEQQLRYPSPESAVVSDVHQKQDQDSNLLENIGRLEESLVCDSHLALLIPTLTLLTVGSCLALRTV
jgi:hypothetical protein